MDADELLDRLHMMNAEAKRVERSARILKQQTARTIEEVEAANSDSPREDTHDERDTD